MNHRSLSILAVASVLVVAACGGGKSAKSTTTTGAAATTTTTINTTVATDTSTVAPTTTTGPTNLDPLTGLPDTDPAVLARPALVVKINDHPYAWPQTGLNQADIVFEELVEGISRFAAVFHDQGSTPVGSIRSARTSDINILALLGKPLLAWSGGNDYVMGAIRGTNVVDVGYPFHSVEGGYFRTNGVLAPHNLFADTAKLFALAQPGQGPPPPVFKFRAAAETLPVTAKDITGVRVNFAATQVQFVWDAGTQVWKRSQGVPGFAAFRPHVDSKGVQVAPQNVVVMFCRYNTSPADAHSPEAQTTGTGTVWVFTGGKVVEGTWSRPTAKAPLTLTDTANAPITLTPGHTWVELAPIGHAVEIPAGAAPDSVQFTRG